MLRSKFKRSVRSAYVLGEDHQGTVELLVVHGHEVPDEKEVTAACQKLSVSIGCDLKIHMISSRKLASLTERGGIERKRAAASAGLHRLDAGAVGQDRLSSAASSS
jgi:hypothetical protein